ncbi:hypothetical protein NQ314_008869 [Rhamnusium bicolor]|uniref:Uncharacterized protein n=1 Tax=Rhamnusium bicolor TaxID=1586634 RepID=A0AAV8Y6V8_9CUCU|nr:hypothetical protein NQ314_008869 [Rhamnusium bicolor]
MHQSSPTKKQFTTFKTCYQVMEGKECEYFLKAIQNANPDKVNIEWGDICYTCKEKGCNQVYRTANGEIKNSEVIVITL